MLSPAEASVVVVDRPMLGVGAGGRVLISTPARFKALIDAIPWGQERGLPDMREELAREAGVDAVCPLTSGIFLRIVCEAAWDEHLAGRPIGEVTPFWRVVRAGSALGKKLACGEAFLREARAAEGLQA